MVESLLNVTGWLLARTPELLLRGLAALLGWAMFAGFGRRRRLMLRNLAAVFPERPAAWHRTIARESCNRMIETGLLALASPHFSLTRVKNMARFDASATSYFQETAVR